MTSGISIGQYGMISSVYRSSAETGIELVLRYNVAQSGSNKDCSVE